MPMPSNIFSLKSKNKTKTTTSTIYSTSTTDQTDSNQLNNSTNNLTKKPSTKTRSKQTYQSINQFFHPHQASASSPSYPSTSAMMPSVASRLKKNIARTKEKILQGIGKTDRTSDESFDLYVENFDRQHSQTSKLTKELNKYVNCLKETQKSSRMFYETLKETYEISWPGSNLFSEQIQSMENKWNDYMNKLINDVQSPLIAYLNEFPELKKKIEKRDNRLLDYDNARHTLESAQLKTTRKQNSTLNSNSLLPSQTSPSASIPASSLTASGGSSSTSSSATDQLTKLTKLKIELEDKQQNYEELNQTLCMSLPVLYENRIKFYSSLFQTFFHTETIFHSDCVEVKSKLDDLCESLSTKTSEQNPNPHKLFQQKQEQLRLLQQQKELEEEEEENERLRLRLNEINTNDVQNEESDQAEATVSRYNAQRSSSSDETSKSLNIMRTENYDNESPKQSISEFVPNADYDSKNDSNENIAINDRGKNIVPNESETTRNTPPKMSNSILKNRCLYKVKATYAYEAKELDELSFIKDDLIDVVDGSESEKEELDDGWLIGVHETTLKRGLFPENFTKRI